ncbi:hypothetical protein [Prosthecobacter sp.]|uniref:hypothetical protein n=1 Tax=Prosthecobacter sp. TaxID=1965333 RepID=UPI003784F695
MAFQFNPESQAAVPKMAPPRERIGWFSISFIGIFGLLLVLFIAWKPLSGAAKAAWARHHVKEAQAAISGNDLVGAVPHIRDACAWAPQDVEVIRVVIDYLKITKSDPSTLAQQLKLLAEKQPLTPDEVVLLGRSLIAVRKTAEARTLYEKMVPGGGSSPASLELLSELLDAEGHTAESAEIMRRSSQLKTNTPEARLQLAVEDRNHIFPEVRQQARAELWNLAELDTVVGLAAADRLVVDPDLNIPEARRLLEIVEHHPLKKLPDRLRVLSALMRLEPERRSAILDEEAARYRSDDKGNLIDLAHWLAQEKEYTRLLEIVPPNLAATSRSLYVSMLEALYGQQRWQELKDLLKQKRPPVSDTLAAIWMADVESRLQPDLSESRRLLTAAIEVASAKLNGDELYAAGLLSERLGLHDLSLRAYSSLAPLVPEKEIMFLQKAYEQAQLQKDGKALLVIARKLHDLRPSSAAFAERYDYLRLILGVEIETVTLATAHTASAEETNALDHISPELLRALAAYRLGDNDSVKAQLHTLPDTKGLSAGQRAVIAGLLAQSGGVARAYQIAEKVPELLLLDEEKSFLNRAK